MDHMGVKEDLKPALAACDKMLAEDCWNAALVPKAKECKTALTKAIETYLTKKQKTKDSLKKLNSALDQVKTCLEKTPPDAKGALAAIQQAKTAATATETLAAKPG